MSQKNSGIYSAFSSPQVYLLFQNAIGARDARKKLVNRYYGLDSVSRILDIGCGTADILEYIPDRIEYVGFDLSEKYIEHAKKKFNRSNVSFYSEEVSKASVNHLGKFDLVLSTGVLHHLDDTSASHLFGIAREALAPGGRLITLDPCFVSDQSMISKALVSSDRGENVRTPSQYESLAISVFDKVEADHVDDFLRVPYDHTVLVCSHKTPVDHFS